MYQALIRTHHITSRKKVAVLKAAARKLECGVLLRSSGVPGVMYVQGKTETDVKQWLEVAHKLRYKDYQLVAPVCPVNATAKSQPAVLDGFQEVGTVKEMATLMQQYGQVDWWKAAMRFS